MDNTVHKTSNTAVPARPKQKTAARKGALSVINGEINTRKRNINKSQLSCQSQKQENPINPYARYVQESQSFDNTNVDCKKLKDENHSVSCKSQKQEPFNPYARYIQDFKTFDNANVDSKKLKDGNHSTSSKSQKQEVSVSPYECHIQELKKINKENVDSKNLKDENHSTRCKFQKQDELFNPFYARYMEELSKIQNNENNLASSSNLSSSDSDLSDIIGVSPEAFKDSHYLYTRKKKEKLNSDLVWCTPYRKDIYEYFKEIEKKFRPNPNYMDKQSDITMKMRSVLVDWFIEVGEEYDLHAETLYRAVSYVDRFLSHMSVLRGKLQLVGTASMFLASKYEEIYPPELKDFVLITDNTYTKKQVLRMEHLILKVLNFDISVPTAYTFQQLYCSMCNASESLLQLSQYICELSLLDGDPFLKFPPSVVAAGSVAVANYTLGLDMWDDNIAEASGYQLSDIMYVILCLFNKYSGISSCPQQAICEKYKAVKYGAVATIQHPEKIIFPRKSDRKLCYV